MQTIKNVCVYCGASPRVSERYLDAAAEVGKILASNQLGLVYGGGRMGLMGTVANSVLENGGKAIGIIPKHLQDREARHDELNELHIVDSMHTRKHMMVERSDAFIILPGGYGTLDEAFEILTWKQLGLHQKPILFLNMHNFWTPLKELKQHLFDEAFIKAEDLKLFSIIDTPAQIVPALLAQLTVEAVPA
ncbi:MAG: Rossman fold protein family [Alphaproteobacteria bacterium]|nr:Rossman fold protein family [Alphaproteobacteria bacterium]